MKTLPTAVVIIGFILIGIDCKCTRERFCNIANDINECCTTVVPQGGDFNTGMNTCLREKLMPVFMECWNSYQQHVQSGMQTSGLGGTTMNQWHGGWFRGKRQVRKGNSIFAKFGKNRRKRCGFGFYASPQVNTDCQDVKTNPPRDVGECPAWTEKVKKCLESDPKYQAFCSATHFGIFNFGMFTTTSAPAAGGNMGGMFMHGGLANAFKLYPYGR